ncbi:MAG: HyaD/HybD family hydrogenase maturation endopeptidase [Coriobacteriales bacterium]|nr:HyaD/HybD family hydrogenase maturation endopeptidase [Coriobacteriales bacterium]
MPQDQRILVMGVGNPLMTDEGIGVRAVERLMSGYEFPPNVTLVDAGTMGFTILDLLRDADRLLVIDAVDGSGHPPGTVMVLSPEDAAPNTVLHSLHDTRLVDVLQAAALMDVALEAAVVVGVQVESMKQWVLELTPAVEAALPIAVAAALDTLRDWGMEPSPREDSDINAAVLEALRTYDPMPGTEVS